MKTEDIILLWKEFVDGKGIRFAIYITTLCVISYFLSLKINISWKIAVTTVLVLGMVSWEYVVLLKYIKPRNNKNNVLICINAESAEQYRKIALLLKEPLDKNSLPEDKSIKYIIPNSLKAGKKLQEHNYWAKKILRHNFIVNISVVTTRSDDKDILKFVTKINCDIDSSGRTQDFANKLYDEIFADFSNVDLNDEANQICVYGENLSILSNIVYGMTYILLSSRNMQNLENGKELLEDAYNEIRDDNANVVSIVRNLILYATALQYDKLKDNEDLFDRDKIEWIKDYINVYEKYHYCGTEYYITYAMYEYLKNRDYKKCKVLLNSADRCADKDTDKRMSKTIVRFNKAFIFLNSKDYVRAFYQYKVAFDMYMKIPTNQYPKKYEIITDIESFINRIKSKGNTLELKMCLAIVCAIKGDTILMDEICSEINKLQPYKKMHKNVKNKFKETIDYILKESGLSK